MGGYAIFEFRNKEEACNSSKDLMPGWEGLVRGSCIHRFSAALESEKPPGGHESREHRGHQFTLLADRATPADDQPGEDAARCAARARI